MGRRLRIVVEKRAWGNLYARSPDLPGVIAVGKGYEDTLCNMGKAVTLHLCRPREDAASRQKEQRVWQGYWLSFRRWNRRTRQYFGKRYAIERVYLEGYRWTPFTRVWLLRKEAVPR